MMKLILLSFFISLCYLQNAEGEVSQATQNIANAVIKEFTTSNLKTYMQKASSSKFFAFITM